ncbi:MAG: PepSY domain-containing protein [Cytophagaceae bacterium]|nr:PepSY domain-containing protein [Gemmatimonadaceae bacterium]
MATDSRPFALVRQGAGALRTVLFWTHLVIGLSAGVLILIMSLTGVMLGAERQMIAWIDDAPRVATVPPTPRLALDSLLALRGIERQDLATAVVKADPHEVVLLRFKERERAPMSVNPYTGEDLSVAPGGKGQVFFSALRRWHRWVGVTSEEARATARMFTGAANLGFVLLALSGLYLWWPRRWTRAAFRTGTIFDVSLRGKPRDFNWHNSLGFWTAIPLFIVAATGAFISYQWPGRWLDRIAGSPEERLAALKPAPAPERGAQGRAGGPGGPGGPGGREGRAGREGPGNAGSAEEQGRPAASLDALVQASAARYPEWRSLTITVPSARDSAASIAVAEGNTFRPDLRSTVILDAGSASVLAVRDYASLSTSRKIRAWTRFGHTGEVFGVTGQVIATIVSAVGVLLVWTGIALALRRFSAWVRRRSKVPALQPSAGD